ncbi:sensor domain-containing diguanylate cyclase [Actinotalea sp. M2MS4P-6]|uniref:histidine kinase N-terminal 7TM domain-containing diguanylate cyclase n=1 Tax=Actinotalea sp. M2MS4P-6 TaxID=2983762 RepID=UPI0021E36313|nr:sensor domain-containing diguanylate cyclase [Actinotalea sp. M2MS4P-6]MCV2395865.1 sensor domain-containing diguanylate cyclase [Actinotalea sp. M2MS4P-6]
MTPWVVASFLSAAISAFALVVALRRRTELTRPLSIGLGSAAVWSLAGGAAQLVTTQAAAEVCIDVVIVAGACALVAAQGYAAALSGHGHLLADPRSRPLLVEPAVVVLAALTDPWHHLVVRQVELDPLRATLGPVLWVHAVYGTVAIVVVAVVHLQSAWASADAGGALHLASLVGVVVPGAALLVSVATAEDQLVDYAGALLGVTALAWLWVDRTGAGPRGLPISTSQTLQALPDAIVVSDARGRIVGANAAAQELLTRRFRSGRSVIGANWTDIVRPELLARLRATDHEVLSVAGGLTLDIRISRLRQAGGALQGTVTVIRDISEIERLRAELAEQTVRDGLTGLHNRRHLDRVLEPLVQASLATGEPLSAIMLDLDHFKAVNDTYGHAVGDEVLVAVGRELARCVRVADVLVRFGGEEFLVLMPGTTADVAAVRAEECRRRVAGLEVRSPGPALQVTLSAGIAVLHTDADTLLREADDALYAAKARGRDRVVVAPSG